MNSFLFAWVLLTLATGVISDVPHRFIHTNLHRIIDLSSPVVREVTTFVLKKHPKVQASGKDYFFSVPSERDQKHLAYISASDKNKEPYRVEKAQFDNERQVIHIFNSKVLI
jgi:hypothetical protein